MFGLIQRGDEISFSPCLPHEWSQAELILTRGDRKLRVLFARAGGTDPADAGAAFGAVALRPGETLRWSELRGDSVYRIVLGAEAEPAARAGQPLARIV